MTGTAALCRCGAAVLPLQPQEPCCKAASCDGAADGLEAGSDSGAAEAAAAEYMTAETAGETAAFLVAVPEEAAATKQGCRQGFP